MEINRLVSVRQVIINWLNCSLVELSQVPMCSFLVPCCEQISVECVALTNRKRKWSPSTKKGIQRTQNKWTTILFLWVKNNGALQNLVKYYQRLEKNIWERTVRSSVWTAAVWSMRTVVCMHGDAVSSLEREPERDRTLWTNASK